MALTLTAGDTVRVVDRVGHGPTARVIFRNGCTVLSTRPGYVEIQYAPRRDRKGRPHSPRGWVTEADVTLEREFDENRRGRS